MKMKNNFLYTFKKIIRECNYDNTYKMALAKALVEIAIDNKTNDDVITINFRDIANRCLKYYWNQTIFFDLIQGSNLKKIPCMVQYTKQLIDNYYLIVEVKQPTRFEKIDFNELGLHNEFEKTIAKIENELPKNVIPRFLNLNGEIQEDIYKFDLKNKTIIINKVNVETLKENSDDLFDLIDYRWGLILETFNSSPRINKKVKIIDGIDIKRNDLKKYKSLLDLENPNHICFICGEKIDDNELSIDHVIPWSYLYSDDIWNLVYVHRNCNSSKNNVIPSEELVNKLEGRNIKLLTIALEKEKTGKNVDELEIANKNDYVRKFWIGCK